MLGRYASGEAYDVTGMKQERHSMKKNTRKRLKVQYIYTYIYIYIYIYIYTITIGTQYEIHAT